MLKKFLKNLKNLKRLKNEIMLFLGINLLDDMPVERPNCADELFEFSRQQPPDTRVFHHLGLFPAHLLILCGYFGQCFIDSQSFRHNRLYFYPWQGKFRRVWNDFF